MIAAMIMLVLGLALFLGIHSVRIVADGLRSGFIARRGLNAWKGVYSLISIAGFVLICIGFGQARQHAVVLWSPPRWTHDVAALLTLIAFILVTAAYVPGNGIKARVKDPMILGVKCWAAGHLLANGTLADSFLNSEASAAASSRWNGCGSNWRANSSVASRWTVVLPRAITRPTGKSSQ